MFEYVSRLVQMNVNLCTGCFFFINAHCANNSDIVQT